MKSNKIVNAEPSPRRNNTRRHHKHAHEQKWTDLLKYGRQETPLIQRQTRPAVCCSLLHLRAALTTMTHRVDTVLFYFKCDRLYRIWLHPMRLSLLDWETSGVSGARRPWCAPNTDSSSLKNTHTHTWCQWADDLEKLWNINEVCEPSFQNPVLFAAVVFYLTRNTIWNVSVRVSVIHKSAEFKISTLLNGST